MEPKRNDKTLDMYHVTWEIELNATSAHEAAQLAQQTLRDPDSTATVFLVRKVNRDDVFAEHDEMVDLSA